MAKLSLKWPVDQTGYRIERLHSDGRGRFKLPEMALITPYIRRNGGKLGYIDPFKFDGLYHRLADCKPTPQGVLEFVSRFGFLGLKDAGLRGANSGASEAVEDIYKVIKTVATLREWKRTRDWKQLSQWVTDNQTRIRAHPVLLPGNPPEPFFRPATLRDAIYLQFLEDLMPGAKMRLCKRPACGEWFKYGPGTSHRKTARFCSERCQNAFKYQRRKEVAR